MWEYLKPEDLISMDQPTRLILVSPEGCQEVADYCYYAAGDFADSGTMLIRRKY